MRIHPPTRRYRAIWISDIHLGTRGCQAQKLLDFLKQTDSDYLYLAGDIVDGWRLKRSWYWPQEHNDVVQKILRKARKGTKVVYVPGNHDEFARGYTGNHFGGVEVVRRVVHETADGRRLLVLHGDEYDVVVRYARWLALLGDGAYTMLLALNHWYNRLNEWMGRPYWSLSAFLKLKVKNAVKYIAEFETAIARTAAAEGVDGIVCGHIHHAEMRTIEGVLYCNDGDWVESCSALVEHHNGRLELVFWAQTSQASEQQSRAEITCESLS